MKNLRGSWREIQKEDPANLLQSDSRAQSPQSTQRAQSPQATRSPQPTQPTRSSQLNQPARSTLLAQTSKLDEAEAPKILAKYFTEVIEKGLTMIADRGGSLAEQIALVNKLIATLSSETRAKQQERQKRRSWRLWQWHKELNCSLRFLTRKIRYAHWMRNENLSGR